MKRLLITAALLLAGMAGAQTILPNQTWSAAQWNFAWQQKMDTVNGVAINPNLGTPLVLHCNNCDNIPAAGLTGLNFSGDVVNSGFATTVIGVNGAAVPVSAAALATNASRQLVAAPVTGSGLVVLATGPTFGGASINATNGLAFDGRSALEIFGTLSSTQLGSGSWGIRVIGTLSPNGPTSVAGMQLNQSIGFDNGQAPYQLLNYDGAFCAGITLKASYTTNVNGLTPFPIQCFEAQNAFTDLRVDALTNPVTFYVGHLSDVFANSNGATSSSSTVMTITGDGINEVINFSPALAYAPKFGDYITITGNSNSGNNVVCTVNAGSGGANPPTTTQVACQNAAAGAGSGGTIVYQPTINNTAFLFNGNGTPATNNGAYMNNLVGSFSIPANGASAGTNNNGAIYIWGTCPTPTGTGVINCWGINEASTAPNTLNGSLTVNSTITPTSYVHGETILCKVMNTAPVNHTGDTNETNLANCPIPAGIGSQATIEVTAMWNRSAVTTNSTTVSVRWSIFPGVITGAVTQYTNATSGNVTLRTLSQYDNTATNAQNVYNIINTPYGASSSAPNNPTVNSNNATWINFSCTNVTSSADTCGLYGYTVKLIKS